MAKPSDYDIANASGASVRTDLNNIFGAIVSLNADTTEPTTTYAYMLWADTTTTKLKIRNGANSAWIEVGDLDQSGLNIVGSKFPNLTSNITATSAELNKLTGLSASTVELNALNGVTAGTAELNLVDGCTATTAELNILDGVTSDKDEINALDMSASASTSGQALTSNGTASVPTWQGIPHQGADYESPWFEAPAHSSNTTLTHGMGTIDVTYTILMKLPTGEVTVLNPELTYPYYNVFKPKGVSIMITSTQFKIRMGYGLAMWRRQEDSISGQNEISGVAYNDLGSTYHDAQTRADFDLKILGYKI